MKFTLVLLLAGAVASGQSLQTQIEQAHSRKDLVKERELLLTAASAGSERDRADAERRLAWLDWRFDKDDDAARAHFDQAEKLKAGLSETLSARARMETARHRFAEAHALAKRALDCAEDNRTRENARVALASATVDEAFATGTSATSAEALDAISAAVRAEPGRFVPARLMYALAMLQHDSARADEALRSYHWGGKLLPLYPEAGLAGGPPDVVTYSRFCRRIKEIADEHYRLQALGKVEWDALHQPVIDEALKFWPELKTEQALLDYLSRRFGAEIASFRFGLEFGHRIVEGERTVEQWGRKVRVRPIVLDSMVSNGFVSWFSDGKESIGGWAPGGNPPSMISVRRDDALLAWTNLHDPVRIADFERKLAQATAEQDEAARTNPHGYIRALELRMYQRASNELIAELQARGMRGNDLRLAFLGEYQRRSIACVDAHEARHIIDVDVTLGVLREMNGALSQVTFGGHPVHCMRGMFGPGVGKIDNGTGEGYGRIMKGLVAWMDAHRNEIKGFDATRPTLPQADLLTEDQFRAVFRGLDPLAKLTSPGKTSSDPRPQKPRV